tara:strand:+ start:272 stop:649 length:378 start_codon:yes stop_codon:yes gene_type:complete
MNQEAIQTIGKNQTPRDMALLFMVNEVEGLVDTFDKNFSEWSNFDYWENIGAQQWIFSRALEVYRGKNIDIKCECCEVIDLNQIEIKNISNQKCYGIKSAYMIKNIAEEIVLAEERRESDGTYSS